MVSRRAEQQEDTRFQILRLLEENPEMSTRQLADAVGISNGTAYYMLKALVQKGMVKLSNFTASQHKGRYAYVLTPRGMREKMWLTARFLRRKRVEFEALSDEIVRLEAELEKGEASPSRPK
ncbi:MarR family EPS-associated transcriptional regulator [Shimia sediminis]|uniref:MarR family EPS-associated transcriptional regulator n=1 Tax=Shimia sediminis TaxID=2497945 RepID=UPI000F8F40B7|nr:MarR family EPS-associated transcriptional regulator [Shimia sediminis]